MGVRYHPGHLKCHHPTTGSSLSTPATDLPADSTHTILELPGQSALSAFRLEKLLGDWGGRLAAHLGWGS